MKSFTHIETVEALSLKSIQSIVRTNPEHALKILVKVMDRRIGKTVVLVEVGEDAVGQTTGPLLGPNPNSTISSLVDCSNLIMNETVKVIVVCETTFEKPGHTFALRAYPNRTIGGLHQCFDGRRWQTLLSGVVPK